MIFTLRELIIWGLVVFGSGAFAGAAALLLLICCHAAAHPPTPEQPAEDIVAIIARDHRAFAPAPFPDETNSTTEGTLRAFKAILQRLPDEEGPR